MRDGGVRFARPITGAGNAPIDSAMLEAMRMLDSSRMLLPLLHSQLHDETPIILRVSADRAESPLKTSIRSAVPLAGLKVPLRLVTRELTQVRGTGNLHYPDDLRTQGIMGEVHLTFVVGDDGLYVDGSAIAERVDHVGFLAAVLAALPSMRFLPTVVEGCPVRTLVQQPFTFHSLPPNSGHEILSWPRRPVRWLYPSGAGLGCGTADSAGNPGCSPARAVGCTQTTERIFAASASGVNGFAMKSCVEAFTPLSTTSSSV